MPDLERNFALSRATKAMLKRRVIDLTAAYNDVARDANELSNQHVRFTADVDIRQGETIMIRVPKRFMVRNR